MGIKIEKRNITEEEYLTCIEAITKLYEDVILSFLLFFFNFYLYYQITKNNNKK